MEKSAIGILQAYLATSKQALEMAETEMRYAGWNVADVENVGREAAYLAVCNALHICEHGTAKATGEAA